MGPIITHYGPPQLADVSSSSSGSGGAEQSSGIGCVAWPVPPRLRLSTSLFRGDTAGAGQVDALPLPASGGSTVVSSRNFRTVGSQIYGFKLPLPVQMALHSNFTLTILGWRAATSHPSSVPSRKRTCTIEPNY